MKYWFKYEEEVIENVCDDYGVYWKYIRVWKLENMNTKEEKQWGFCNIMLQENIENKMGEQNLHRGRAKTCRIGTKLRKCWFVEKTDRTQSIQESLLCGPRAQERFFSALRLLGITTKFKSYDNLIHKTLRKIQTEVKMFPIH